MGTNEYEQAYQTAMQELLTLEAQKKQIEIRLYVLKQAILQLRTLAGLPAEKPEFPMPKLTEAIEHIFKKADRTSSLTPRDIRDELMVGGYNTKPYKNFLASVHAVLRRMEERKEIEKDDSGAYQATATMLLPRDWKG